MKNGKVFYNSLGRQIGNADIFPKEIIDFRITKIETIVFQSGYLLSNGKPEDVRAAPQNWHAIVVDLDERKIIGFHTSSNTYAICYYRFSKRIDGLRLVGIIINGITCILKPIGYSMCVCNGVYDDFSSVVNMFSEQDEKGFTFYFGRNKNNEYGRNTRTKITVTLLMEPI